MSAARLQLRAIVAARRIEDRQREIDEAFALVRTVDDALDGLKETSRNLASVAELADEYGRCTEGLLAAACAELPPHHRARLTAIARSMANQADTIACILNRLSLELAITTEHLDEGGAP